MLVITLCVLLAPEHAGKWSVSGLALVGWNVYRLPCTVSNDLLWSYPSHLSPGIGDDCNDGFRHRGHPRPGNPKARAPEYRARAYSVFQAITGLRGGSPGYSGLEGAAGNFHTDCPTRRVECRFTCGRFG